MVFEKYKKYKKTAIFIKGNGFKIDSLSTFPNSLIVLYVSTLSVTYGRGTVVSKSKSNAYKTKHNGTTHAQIILSFGCISLLFKNNNGSKDNAEK